MTALVAKLAGAACTFLAVLATVAACSVLFVMVMMPFVFPLFLVGAALLTHPLEQQNPALVAKLPTAAPAATPIGTAPPAT
jgi:hypothetical protein